MAPVATALARRGIEPTLIFTGQHPTLDPADFGLAAFPAASLGCRGEVDPHAHVRSVSRGLSRLLAPAPDLVVVQGDTSSALGGALAAFAAGVPVAHVEAGLRTHDPQLPWPEEEYRVAIDAFAELLFAPTEIAAANLRAEMVPGQIHVTGNTAIDALLATERSLPSAMPTSEGRRVLFTCHRRESWRSGLHSVAAAIAQLAKDGAAQIDVLLHPNPQVADIMRRSLQGCPQVYLVEPCSHSELVRRVRDCDLVLSDSGGIQEEAPALGTPLLVLRDKTERPEAIASGNARLIGTSTVRIVEEARRLLDHPMELAAMARPALPFGDGRSGPRIAALIDSWLHRRRSVELLRAPIISLS